MVPPWPSYLLALVLSLFNCSLFAQYWEPTTLVMVNGDTLKGEIGHPIQRKRFFYRLAEGGLVSTLDADMIRSYTTLSNQLSYESITVALTYYSKLPVAPEQSPISRYDTLHVFADVVFRADDVALLSFHDSSADLRFALQKGGDVTVLKNVSFDVMHDDRAYRYERPYFRKQLEFSFPRCKVDTRKVEYSSKSLAAALRKFIACTRN